MQKKDKKWLIVTLIFAGILVIGATYAYYAAQGGAATSNAVKVQTNTTDNLSFSTGSAINLVADQTSFASGKGNVSGSTTATALLTANNNTNKATMNYNVYLNIASNEFVYSISSSSPELILTVYSPSGTILKELDGLNYVTSGGVSGFDITTTKGLINLAENYEITASHSKSESWKVMVTFVNLNGDQNKNANKHFTATLIVGKNKQTSTIASSGCTSGNNLATCIMNMANNTSGTNLYYHDSKLANGAGDNSYRFAGASDSVNNYVCFGSTATTCPDANLYRIIGVFNGQAKLVKATAGTSALLGTTGDYASGNLYYFNYKANTTLNSGNGSSDWSTSLLNKTNLNTTYLNGLGSTWSGKIATTAWKYYGFTADNRSSLKSVYTSEMTSSPTYSAKIGLMYASDYGYAFSPKAWSLPVFNSSGADVRTYIDYNWIYKGEYEATISQTQDGTATRIFGINSKGYISYTYASSQFIVSPCFYLNANVTYASGAGTKASPIRLT